MATTKRYLGVQARAMKPTKRHRTAVWECMLGTVYARNDKGQVKYFDYKHEEALEFAGVTPDRDPRVFRYPRCNGWGSEYAPRSNQLILYILKE